jgi:predicted nucleotidyltransferase
MTECSDRSATPISDLPPEEEFAAYLPHVRRRWLARQEAGERRRGQAWKAAREVATLLRGRFDAQRVVAFGSLVGPDFFSERSDVDLAVSGIPPKVFFKAWAAAADACPFQLDLVDLADCSAALQRLIEEEGVEL